jgi:glycine cleavage system H protein
VNTEVIEAPEKINADPYASWIFKLQPVSVAELNNLLDAAGYQAVGCGRPLIARRLA